MRASTISLILLALTISCGQDDSKSSSTADESPSTLASTMLTGMARAENGSETSSSSEVEFKWTDDELVDETANCIRLDWSGVKRESFQEQIPSFCYCLTSLMAIKHTYDEFLDDRVAISDKFITNGTPFCMDFSEKYVADHPTQ